LFKLHRRALFGVSRWGRLSSVPDAIHLLSMLVYKRGDGIWGAIVFVYFDETIIALLEFMRSWAT
jgi:hypothetical protein